MDIKEKLVELLRPWLAHLSLAAANDLVANGVTVQEWISVKDRLPVKDGWYLCLIRPSAFRGAAYHTILPYDKNGFRIGYGYTNDVTHWMPLPQPPVDMSKMFENVSTDDLRPYREKTQPPKGEI